MTVQHVHIAEGGQAILGNVSSPAPGVGAREKNRRTTSCIGLCCELASNVDPLHVSPRSLILKWFLARWQGQNSTPIQLASNHELPKYFITLPSKARGVKIGRRNTRYPLSFAFSQP